MTTRRTSITIASIALAAGIILLAVGLGTFAYTSRPQTAITFPPGGTSTSSPTNSTGPGETILVQVVNGTSSAPLPGTSVSAGPASSPEDLTFTPGGPTLTECVHQVPSGSSVGNGTAVSNGTTITFPTCPLKGYTTNTTGWVSIPNITGTGFYFIKAGTVNQWNDLIVGVIPNSTLKFTFPLPSDNITYSNGGETCVNSQFKNITSTCVPQSIPVLWPHTTTVLSCGEGVPSGSAVTGQGVYAGYYIAYAFANFPNDTKAALAYCPDQTGGTSPGPNPVISGSLVVPNGSGQGTLAVTARNNGNITITSITVGVSDDVADGAVDSGVVATSGGETFTAGGPPFTMYNGSLGADQRTSAVIQLSGLSAGQIYYFTITSHFSDGSSDVQLLSVTAQA